MEYRNALLTLSPTTFPNMEKTYTYHFETGTEWYWPYIIGVTDRNGDTAYKQVFSQLFYENPDNIELGEKPEVSSEEQVSDLSGGAGALDPAFLLFVLFLVIARALSNLREPNRRDT